jgi:hypothetical protein
VAYKVLVLTFLEMENWSLEKEKLGKWLNIAIGIAQMQIQKILEGIGN